MGTRHLVISVERDAYDRGGSAPTETQCGELFPTATLHYGGSIRQIIASVANHNTHMHTVAHKSTVSNSDLCLRFPHSRYARTKDSVDSVGTDDLRMN